MTSVFSQNFTPRNEQIRLPLLAKKNIELWVKREDEIHPFVSGNKFRKLKYNFAKAKELKADTVLSFGGAFSNHILATAVAAKQEGFKSIGIIRGDELSEDINKTFAENKTLLRAYQAGMQLHFVSRSEYRKKDNSDYREQLERRFGAFYKIPEGGTNELAVQGCEEILSEQDVQFDYICSCVGTGGTLAGLIRSAKSHQTVLGFPALKGDFLAEAITKWVPELAKWHLVNTYHFGGYAKYNEALVRFINTFKQNTGLALDPIYTGKMMFGLFEEIAQDRFERGAKILVIHTGGLQGIEGFNSMQEKKKTGLQIT